MPYPRVQGRLGAGFEIPYFSTAWPRRPGLGAPAAMYGSTRLGAPAAMYGSTRLGSTLYRDGAPYYGSYGAYLIQAGLGRYGRMQAQPSNGARRMRGYARLGGATASCHCGGYPKRLGQSWWSDTMSSLFGQFYTPSGQGSCDDALGCLNEASAVNYLVSTPTPGAGGAGLDPHTGAILCVDQNGNNQSPGSMCPGVAVNSVADCGKCAAAQNPGLNAIPGWVWGIAAVFGAAALYRVAK
jgi:hypothetical protein